MQLFLTPCTPLVFGQFAQFMRLRGQNPPPPPPEAIMVCNGDAALIAGVCLYPSGPFLFAEFAVTCPYVPSRVRHRAVDLVIQTYLMIASQRGLAPFTFPNNKGLVRMLMRYGLLMQKAVVLSRGPAAYLMGDTQEKKTPEVLRHPGVPRPITNAEEPMVQRPVPPAKERKRVRRG